MPRKAPPPDNPTGLYFARELRKMSQDHLAEAAGTTKAQVSKLENGSRELTRAWAERFAGPLKFSAIRIVFWDKVGPPVDSSDVESEFAVPGPVGWERSTAVDRTASAGKPAKPVAQKKLRSSSVKLYVRDWRIFMMGERTTEAAKALGLKAEEYDEIEQFPFRLTADELAVLGKAIGVAPSQFFFPVKVEHLTPSQKKTPAGIRLLKLVKS